MVFELLLTFLVFIFRPLVVDRLLLVVRLLQS